jgi:hypothetical protein
MRSSRFINQDLTLLSPVAAWRTALTVMVRKSRIATTYSRPPPHPRPSGQIAYMQLAAWDYGIGSCLAPIINPERFRLLLHIPQNLIFNSAISFGILSRQPVKKDPFQDPLPRRCSEMGTLVTVDLPTCRKLLPVLPASHT